MSAQLRSAVRRSHILFGLTAALIFATAALAQTSRPADHKAEFLRLCEVACKDLNSPERNVPFYNDSYAVRALCVAYDLTGNAQYLQACRTWADRMIKHQEGMTPKGAYYMNYNRKPGETKGAWYVADSSSIAMGVLVTAVRCDGADRQKYLASAEAFAKLVMDNYIGPHGGIRNGLWPKFDGEWWCSSGIFGSLAFLLYDETGERRYLDAALGAVDWMNSQRLADFKPYSIDEMGPTLPMYVLEAYSAGMPRLIADRKRAKDVLRQWDENLAWMRAHQGGRGSKQKWSDYTHQWGSKFGGLPFHMYIYASHYIMNATSSHMHPSYGNAAITKAADQELAYITSEIGRIDKPGLSQLAAFAMMSYAERVSPGTIYRNGRTATRPAAGK